MKNNIIFLDIDGVLNGMSGSTNKGRFCGMDDEKIIRLKSIVDYMNADIVLSSTWKDFWQNKDARKTLTKYGFYLDLKLAQHGLEIEDKTGDISCMRRAEEIREWLISHPEIKNYLILDDEYYDWDENGLRQHWISTGVGDIHTCKHGDGLKEEHVLEAKLRYDLGMLKYKK